MRRYVISKYINNLPNENEWTDFSDIGIEGKKFLLEDYLHVEDKYLDAVNEILSRLNIDKLYIKEYTENNIINKSYQNIILSLSDSYALMRRILRNDLTHCVFYFPRKIRITFGFDYFMYITCNIRKVPMIKILKKYNLYCS